MIARLQLLPTLAATIGLMVGLVACGSSSTSTANTGAGSATPAAPPLSSTGKPVPAPLDELEAQAEDIGDQVPGQAWAKVATDVTTVTDTWTAYQAQATADGAPADLVAALTKAIAELSTASAAKQAIETRQGANDVSAAVVELYGLYDTGRPVNIGRLDVIGRQIVLAADASDKTATLAQIAKARGEWTAIEGDVNSRKGSDVVKRTNATLDSLTTSAEAGNFKEVATQANNLLELVDDMEGLY